MQQASTTSSTSRTEEEVLKNLEKKEDQLKKDGGLAGEMAASRIRMFKNIAEAEGLQFAVKGLKIERKAREAIQ